MPYERTESKLNDFIAQALSDEEIRDGAAQAELTEDDLRRDLLDPNLEEKAPKIWEAAAGEIEEYDKLENTYKAQETNLRREEQRIRRPYLRLPRWALVAIFVTLSPIFLLPLLLIFLSILVSIGLLSSPVSIGSVFSGSIFSDTLSAVAAVLSSITILLVYTVVCRSLYRRYLAAKEQRDSRLIEIQSELQALERRLETARGAVERAVIEKGILQELRDIIGRETEPSYETRLSETNAKGLADARGLAEVSDLRHEIATESKDKLRRLLDNMPGGSIGIAGPRGVGKTTLMESFCSKSSTNELNGRRVLSVMIPAPVEYDAREFTLHIFSSVCHRALELKGKAKQPPWEQQIPSMASFSKVVGVREALASVVLGLLFLVSRLVMPIPSELEKFFSAFFFGFGLFLIILGAVGLAIWGEQQFRQLRQTQQEGQQRNKRYGDGPLVAEASLVAKADKWIREIEFQQSYSSGWGGSLKGGVPAITLEAKVDNSMSLARNQMTLPEIVDRYKEVLNHASEEYEIIIGIDELDKIGSDEQARRFLNDIKGLFGVKSCFYLISVSESAMSSFERRGLPFRDVFDSSLDTVVYADYLNLKGAQRLLRRRVIGVPVPFLDFCHCMAGGLPRDLIRIFRSMVEEHQQADGGESSLSTLCGSLIRADLKAKLRAAAVAAKDIMLEPEVNRLFKRIAKLESLLESPDGFSLGSSELLVHYKELLASASQEPTQQAEPAEVTAKRERMASLSTELGVYLYYSATLLEFFGQEDFSIEALQAAENSGVSEGKGTLDQLARARQFFAISPRTAEMVIADFREAHDMQSPDVMASPATLGSEY